MSSADQTDRSAPLDAVVVQLQELRLAAGEPSYAEIAARIARLRTARGATTTARVGRTTVYDAFRVGRRRMDLDLVLDIVRALGADEAEVHRWRLRAMEAQRANRIAKVVVVEPDPEPEPAPQPQSVDAVRLTVRFIALSLPICVGMNLLGRVLVDSLGLSIYLDMSGTAVAAVLLGPWWAALVAVLTNTIGVLTSGVVSLPFMIVNVVGALIWGYGYHRFDLGRTFLRFFTLNLIVGTACTLVAVPILLILFGGFTDHHSSDVARAVYTIVPSVPVAVIASNLVLSLIDKLVSGYLALIARESVDAARSAAPRA